MGHHGRANNAKCQIQHILIAKQIDGRCKANNHAIPIGIGHGDLNTKAHRNHCQQRDNKPFDPAKTAPLKPQDQQHISRCDQNTQLKRDRKQKVQRNRRPDHLGQVRGTNRQFGKNPQWPRNPHRECITARLRKIAPRSNRKPRAQRLQHNRHHIGQQRHKQQRIAKLRSARQRGRPVSGIHIANRNKVSRPGKGKELTEFSGMAGDRNGSKNLDHGWIGCVATPSIIFDRPAFGLGHQKIGLCVKYPYDL